MSYLIDGYNLLHALGRLTGWSGRGALQGARGWLLRQLRQAHGPEEVVTVVFDAATAPPGARERKNEGGLHFVFAQGETADDVIEDLIQAEANPRQLTVISDDHRLQNAGRRRGCNVLGCLDYYEGHLQPRRPPAAAAVASDEPPAKPEPADDEVEHWLDAFGDVGDDPLLKDPF